MRTVWKFGLPIPLLAAGCLVCLAVSVASADTLPSRSSGIYADGRYGFKVVPSLDNPDKEPARAVLFEVGEGGSDHVLWRGKLLNTPDQVFVGRTPLGGGPFVITVDTYAHMGYEHSLVIYFGLAGNMREEDGSLYWDYALEDLLTPSEIATKVRRSISGRWWAKHARFAFEGEYFVIRLDWGRTLRIHLRKGKVERLPLVAGPKSARSKATL